MQLTKKEIKESNQLLKAAIQHWKALGDVSPDSLREGFLRRSGKLVRYTDQWKLIVEQKAIDVLLDSLPWGIGMVKLPWMEEMLSVEWSR